MENAASTKYAQLGIALLTETVAETMQGIMNDDNLVNSDCIANINNFIKNNNIEDIELIIAK